MIAMPICDRMVMPRPLVNSRGATASTRAKPVQMATRATLYGRNSSYCLPARLPKPMRPAPVPGSPMATPMRRFSRSASEPGWRSDKVATFSPPWCRAGRAV